MRKTKFANNEYYHIYNRGVDKRDVFTNEKDFFRFLKGMKEFNRIDPIGSLSRRHPVPTDPEALDACIDNLVEIIAYCLNSNHFHLILKQITENGISKFMHKLTMGYTNYFNLKYDRSGALFQGNFKSVHINANEYLLWLSGYVNGNDRIHQREQTPSVGDFRHSVSVSNWQYSSYSDYLGLRNGTLCNQEEMKIILDQFPNAEEYEKFVEMVIKESRKRKDVEKFLLE
jgi:REP element-mobilizing transposase RayT